MFKNMFKSRNKNRNKYVDVSKKFSSHFLPVLGGVAASALLLFPETSMAFTWADVNTVITDVGTSVTGASNTVWTAGSLMAMATAGIKIVYRVVFGSLG